MRQNSSPRLVLDSEKQGSKVSSLKWLRKRPKCRGIPCLILKKAEEKRKIPRLVLSSTSEIFYQRSRPRPRPRQMTPRENLLRRPTMRMAQFWWIIAMHWSKSMLKQKLRSFLHFCITVVWGGWVRAINPFITSKRKVQVGEVTLMSQVMRRLSWVCASGLSLHHSQHTIQPLLLPFTFMIFYTTLQFEIDGETDSSMPC